MDFGRLLDMRKNLRAEDAKRILQDNFNVAFVEERAVNMLEPEPFELLVWKIRSIAESEKIQVARDSWERQVANELRGKDLASITPEMIRATLKSLNIYVYGR